MRIEFFPLQNLKMRAARSISAIAAALILQSCGESAASGDAPVTEKSAPHSVTVVVLGSSSPAGKNIYKLFDRPKSEEAAYARKYSWVTLYDEYLKSKGPYNKAVNMSSADKHSTSIVLNEKKGGALFKNSLAYALKTYPQTDAIIVNFPAVRGQEGETVESVIENLKEIERRALAAGVGKVWIATAQPAANKSECFRAPSGQCDPNLTIYQTRIDLTDAIIAAFPESYLDFYTPLAKGGRRTAVADPALLNLKDKLHPNLKGHEVLRDVVIAAGVYETARGN